MSEILRNTLRLVGTAKYATNNSTKYLRSITVTTNRLNHSLQSPGPLTNVWTTIRAAGKTLLPTFNDDRIKTSSIGDFEVSLSDSNVNVKVMSDKNIRNLIWPPTFSTEFNGKSIKPESNKNSDIERSFNVGVCNSLLHGAELKLKLIDSGKTFILKHEIHVKAFQKSPKPVKGGYKRIAPKLDDRFVYSNAKIISKVKGLEPKEREFKAANNLLSNKFVESPKESQDKITDGPDESGKMKLQIPMTVLLEGASYKMKIKDSDD
ncbi:hypothetical protein HCN44_001984 [Aphidius gifuensis]|uniref:Uncharacterized protein n=2 Tax=Aphidius gifuensis TaxID=684658 RepID=A0A834Y3Z2_APHGI|nr:hypothetical protein HCN44_001984 [Aphidius gifuensis]